MTMTIFFHFFTIFLSISQKSHLQIFIEFLSQLVTLEWAPALNDNCPCFRWQLPLLRTCSLEVPLKESTCWSKGQRPLRPLSSFGLGKSSPEIRYSLFYQNLGSYCSHIVKVVQFFILNQPLIYFDTFGHYIVHTWSNIVSPLKVVQYNFYLFMLDIVPKHVKYKNTIFLAFLLGKGPLLMSLYICMIRLQRFF